MHVFIVKVFKGLSLFILHSLLWRILVALYNMSNNYQNLPSDETAAATNRSSLRIYLDQEWAKTGKPNLQECKIVTYEDLARSFSIGLFMFAVIDLLTTVFIFDMKSHLYLSILYLISGCLGFWMVGKNGYLVSGLLQIFLILMNFYLFLVDLSLAESGELEITITEVTLMTSYVLLGLGGIVLLVPFFEVLKVVLNIC